jgi:hypothetical protein
VPRRNAEAAFATDLQSKARLVIIFPWRCV